MPLYRHRHVSVGPDGEEVVGWRYTDRQRRVAPKPQPAVKTAQARPQAQPEPIPVETVETAAPIPTPAAIDANLGTVFGGALQAQLDNEREKLMADLARQVSEFGSRIATLEGRADELGEVASTSIGALGRRLDEMARTVAKIEAHDKRHDERLSRLEATAAAHDDRLQQIEGALGTLAVAAEEMAKRGSA